MNTGESIALAIVVFSLAQIASIVYKARKDELLKRERIVQDTVRAMVFENGKAINDGFIFCSLWRISAIMRRAEAMGFTFTIYDCYQVVARIKRDFDPDIGISHKVIDKAIHAFVMKNLNLPDPRQWDRSIHELINKPLGTR